MSDSATRLGPVSTHQIQAALDRFHLGTLITISSVPIGMGGQTLFISSSAGEYVFRGNPLFPGQFAKECFIAHLLHDQTSVPVPYPYYVDDSDELFGWSYALIPRLPGSPLHLLEAQSPLSPSDLLAITRLLAGTLVDLQKATWPHVGDYDPALDTIVPLPGSLTDRERGFVRTRLAWARDRTGRIDEQDFTWAEDILSHGRDVVDNPPVATVVLHDYQVGNMVFERAADQWSVTGLFDFAEAYIGDPDTDLARTVNALLHGGHVDLARIFVQRYLHLRGSRPGLSARLATYLLSFLIIEWGFDAHRCDRSFRSWAGERLALLSQVASED